MATGSGGIASRALKVCFFSSTPLYLQHDDRIDVPKLPTPGPRAPPPMLSTTSSLPTPGLHAPGDTDTIDNLKVARSWAVRTLANAGTIDDPEAAHARAACAPADADAIDNIKPARSWTTRVGDNECMAQTAGILNH